MPNTYKLPPLIKKLSKCPIGMKYTLLMIIGLLAWWILFTIIHQVYLLLVSISA